jgi:hypothetical protein
MMAWILSLLLAAQGATRLPTDAGTITGVIKTAAGAPATGVRVTAVARPEIPADAIASVSFASLAETDENGRYRLENVPPGNYYVSAGRMDAPTFYPGTQEMSRGTAVSVKTSALISNIDFVLDESSVRLPDNDVTPMLGAISGLTLPVQVHIEGGAKQPVVSENHLVLLRLTRVQDQTRSDLPLTESIQNFSIPDPLPGSEYRISVENLPRGYVVKSIIHDGVNLLNGTLKLTTKNFITAPVSVKDLTAPGAFKDTVQFRSNAGVPMTPIEITLAAAPAPPDSGLRVTGRASSTGVWFPTLLAVPEVSGNPGTFFADGSFEFRCASNCGNLILLRDQPNSPTHILAASVILRTEGLTDVLAEEIPVLPIEFVINTSIAGGGPGPEPEQIPLAGLRGRVVDDSSKEPVLGGHVTLSGSGKTKAEFPIDSLGLFEIPRLLPGMYELTIDGFQHASIHQSVAVGIKDVQLNVSVKAGN